MYHVRTYVLLSTKLYYEEEEEEAPTPIISLASEERGTGVEEADIISVCVVRFIASSISRAPHKSLLNLSVISISRVLGYIRRL